MSQDQYARGGMIVKPILLAHVDEGCLIPIYGAERLKDICLALRVPAELFDRPRHSIDLTVETARRLERLLYGNLRCGTHKREGL